MQEILAMPGVPQLAGRKLQAPVPKPAPAQPHRRGIGPTADIGGPYFGALANNNSNRLFCPDASAIWVLMRRSGGVGLPAPRLAGLG